MSKKKMVMSVTASAAIAAALFGADEVEAASYKVKQGDTLWKIAQKHGTSVANLKSLNNLKSDIIYPNQVLSTSGSEKSSANSSSSNNSSSKSSSSNSSSSSSSKSSGNTYTVKRGDTLSAIASRHGISLQNLMKWNNLNTTLIYPGNVFYVTNPGSSSKSTTPTNNNSSSSNSSSSNNTSNSSQKSGATSTYTVKSGDTLSRIARNYGVTVANLKQWNNLSSDMIYIGQKLSIGGGKASAPKQQTSSNNSGSSSSSNNSSNVSAGYDVSKLVNIAKSQIGVKYVWGGTTPSGFDCSGFIYYAYKNAGKDVSRLTTDGYFNRSYYVNSPQVGDLVFFKNTYRSGISHMGIYLGGGQFIHAGSSTGVTIASVDNSYWKKHFDSYKRFY